MHLMHDTSASEPRYELANLTVCHSSQGQKSTMTGHCSSPKHTCEKKILTGDFPWSNFIKRYESKQK